MMKRYCFVLAIGAVLLAVSPVTADAINTNDGAPPAGSVPSDQLPTLSGNVLVYANYNYIDTDDELQNVIQILTAAGKTVTTTATTDPTTLSNELVGKIAFVVPELFDDSWPDAAQLAMIAATFTGFAPVLQSFMAAGNNVVVCEGDMSCPAGETVVNAIGVANITWIDQTLGQNPLTIVLPLDPLMVGIASITGVNGDGSYVDNSGGLIQVVLDPTGDIVVSRLVWTCGNFVILAFDYFSWVTGEQDILLANAAQLPPAGPSGVEATTWGAVKSLYR